MGWKRSGLEWKRVKIYEQLLLVYLLICTIQTSSAATDPTDVAAINSLYIALGSPVLPGWVASGGDPCGEGWQGILCNGSFIQKIVLNGANLGGELGDKLSTFVSISVIDLSSNNIGGNIPSSLPVTLRNFFLAANQFTGSIPASLSTLTGLTDMSLNENFLTGEIPDAFQSLTQLINLDLSQNNLSGKLPPSMDNLLALTTLRLQNNQLSGTLDVLQDLPLKDLNVENNQFAGPIPPKLLSIPAFRQAGNPFNVSGSTTTPASSPRSPAIAPPGTPVSGTPPSSGRVPTKQADGPTAANESHTGKSKKSTKRVVWISIASVLGFIILLLGFILFIPRCSRRERDDRRSKRHQIGAYGGERQSARDLLLAVKKLDKRASAHQKDDEFLKLINSIDRIRHANVVELVGYCSEHGQRLLIYEYCSNGSLFDALHSDDDFKTRLSWNSRIRISLGAARALEYLHEQCQPPVVHRNLKSANILLDDDLSVRVSDCGLAPLIASGSVSQLSGNLLTAYGYGAPEFESGIYTYQSDVYSFGVIMLELLTGRPSHDRTRPRGEQFLVRWAVPQLHDIDALSRMVDPSLNGNYPAKSLSNFADIISRCLQSEPEFRPAMSEVVLYLLNMIRKESQQTESNEK
uniref:Protein kinase domain-containing protein n=1 Tax=Glycine max TaxID=3847 RepID=A0A0R0JNC2_SOYBN